MIAWRCCGLRNGSARIGKVRRQRLCRVASLTCFQTPNFLEKQTPGPSPACRKAQYSFFRQSALVVQERVARPACALFARPSAASARPAMPSPNFFNAARRVTDWARPLVISSNLSLITFLSLLVLVVVRLETRRLFTFQLAA